MLEAGTAVGRYVIQRKLAEGGMAEIYLATATGAEGFSKEVVIKVVRPFLASDAQFVQMFIAEARLVSRLNHPNIVQIFDFGKHEDTYFLAMEYVRGASLWELRKRCRELGLPFPPTLGAEIAAQVARGLHFAHQLSDGAVKVGVVHRDVTPHNILLSFDGAVKLTDFGIAKATTAHTAPGMLKGKFAYMAPEQARGDAVDARTDVFALGIVTWELLTGGRLFDGDSDVAVLKAVQESLIAPPTRLNPDVPRELSDLVMKALSRRPEERFQTAGDLERALATFAIRAAQSVEDTSVGLFLQQLFREEFEPGPVSRDLPGGPPVADALGSADTLFLARARARPQGTITQTPVGSLARQATPGLRASGPSLADASSTTDVPAVVPGSSRGPGAGQATDRIPSLDAAAPRPSTEQLPAHRPPSSRRLEAPPPPAPDRSTEARGSGSRLAAPARGGSGSRLAVAPPSEATAATAPRRPAWLVVVAVLAGVGALGGGAAMTVFSRSRLAPPAVVPAGVPPSALVPPVAPAPAPVEVAAAEALTLGELVLDAGPPARVAEAPSRAPEPPAAKPAAEPPPRAVGEAAAPAPAVPGRAEVDAAAAARVAARAPRPGILKVLVRPFGFVSIDGGRHLEVPGSKQLPVRAGRHEVELFDNHEASVRKVSVMVEAGETLTVEAD